MHVPFSQNLVRSCGHFASGEESAASELHSIRFLRLPRFARWPCWSQPQQKFASMNSLSDVTEWLQVPPQIAEAWFEKLGATRIRRGSWGMLTHQEVDTEVMTIRIDDKPLNLLQKGLLRAALHVCRLVSGVAQSVEAKAASVSTLLELDPYGNKRESEPTVAPLIVRSQVALKQVISQGSKETVPKLSAKELSHHWDRFKEVLRQGPTARRRDRGSTHFCGPSSETRLCTLRGFRSLGP